MVDLSRSELEKMESERLMDLVSAFEAIVSRMHVLAAYGSLWFASDTQSEAALAFRTRVEQALTILQNRTLFFTQWWKGLEDKEADLLLAAVPEDNADAAFFLAEERRVREYRLDEQSEQIVNLKDADGIRVAQSLLDVFGIVEFHDHLYLDSILTKLPVQGPAYGKVG